VGDDGIVVVSLQDDNPQAWVRFVEEKPRARILEVRLADAAPTAQQMKSLRNLAKTYGLELRLRGTASASE